MGICVLPQATITVEPIARDYFGQEGQPPPCFFPPDFLVQFWQGLASSPIFLMASLQQAFFAHIEHAWPFLAAATALSQHSPA